jgi:hypothetical protein
MADGFVDGRWQGREREREGRECGRGVCQDVRIGLAQAQLNKPREKERLQIKEQPVSPHFEVRDPRGPAWSSSSGFCNRNAHLGMKLTLNYSFLNAYIESFAASILYIITHVIVYR